MDNLFDLTADVNGKPIPRWQERLEGMYTDYVPFGEILSLVRVLIDESAIEHILKMPDEDVLASFPGDVNAYAEEMRQKFDVIARLTRELAAARAYIDYSAAHHGGEDDWEQKELLDEWRRARGGSE